MNAYCIPGLIREKKKIITVTDVETVVCDHFQIDKFLLKAKTRKYPVPLCRHLIYYFAKGMQHHGESLVNPSPSLTEIAARYNQDHTTAINGIEVINNRICYEYGFVDLVVELENKIKAI